MNLILLCIYYVSMAFGVFSIFYYTLNIYFSRKFKEKTTLSAESTKNVTIIIPVYKESTKSFSETLKAATSQGARVIVFGDGCDEPYKSIAIKMGAIFKASKSRKGKRAAISQAMKFVKTKYVMLLDSDTVIPEDAVKKLLSDFKPGVGGVCPNIYTKKTGDFVSYCSEFLERTKEIIYKALAFHGDAMILTGQCAIYRTALIRDLVESKSFGDFRIFGASFGEDRQLTNFIVKKGYKAVQDFSIKVFTEPQKTFTNFLRQQIRWCKTGYAFLFQEIKSGTIKKRGFLYAMDNLYIYILPIFALITLLFYAYFLLAHPYFFYDAAENILSSLTRIFEPGGVSLLANTVTSVLNRGTPNVPLAIYANLIIRSLVILSIVLFFVLVVLSIKRDKIKTFWAGVIAFVFMFLLSLYSLATLWKKQAWSTRG